MTEEYKNDQCHVLVTREKACRVKFDVNVKGNLVKKARNDAIKTVNKLFVHPGFRRGKAPESVVLQKYAPDVEREFHRFLADASYVEAQKQAKVQLLNNNSKITFEMKNANETEANLSFSFETEPTIPSVDPALFTPKPVTRPPVEDKQIEEAIHQMRFYYAEWENETDRGIQEGDYIMINLDTAEERVFDHIRFEVSSDRMAEWMKKLVMGAKAGEILKGMSVPDETATEEEKAEFKPKEVTITIIKVETAKLPVIDDEFAKKVGATDAEAMRKSVTDLLSARADEKVQNELREQVNDFLVEKYPFDIPQSLIETEKKHRLDQLLQNPKFKESWEKNSKEEKEKVLQKIEEEAGQAVRLFYLSRQIVREANLPITHKEIQDEALVTLRSFGQLKLDKIPKEVYALALSKLILAKAQDHIIGKEAATQAK